MKQNIKDKYQLNACSQTRDDMPIRNLNPMDISVPPGYSIEIFAQGLDIPISMAFADDGSIYIAESGYASVNPKILHLSNGRFEVVADGFHTPITGINYINGDIYVSHRGRVTVIKRDGSREDIIIGLPSNGDYGNCKVVLGSDNKLYFGQGTVTNSGVVGEDNPWVLVHPLIHDHPGSYIMLQGHNYETNNMFSNSDEVTYTGAFSPYGVPNLPYEVRKGVVKASGSILRTNLDGTEMELVAWGFRSPFYIRFDESNRLFAVNRGYDVRGSRPIANSPDEFHLVIPGLWYGWPDYAGGEPVTLPRFRPEGGVQPEFLLENHPNNPPLPYTVFPPHSTIAGFDFNYNNEFGPYGDVYIAEFGSHGPATMGPTTPYAGIGHRISRIEMNTGRISTFAINKSGFPSSITREGGFGRPVDISFGPDGAMYVLDLGINDIRVFDQYIPNTGVIWKITRSS